MNAGTGVPLIVCPAGIFLPQEREIARLTDALNRATTLAEKALQAVELRAAADRLLNCDRRLADNVNCRLCEGFSSLRARTMDLILHTARRVA